MKILRFFLPLVIGIGLGLGIYHQFICIKKEKEQTFTFRDFTFTSIQSSVPQPDADKWVRNYRDLADRTDLTKVFALNLEKNDIKKFYDTANFGGLRLYFGLKDKSKPTELSIIATGYRDAATGTDNEDFYLNETVGGKTNVNVVDDMSKCPTMCPKDIPGRNMLGLYVGQPKPGLPTDRPSF